MLPICGRARICEELIWYVERTLRDIFTTIYIYTCGLVTQGLRSMVTSGPMYSTHDIALFSS